MSNQKNKENAFILYVKDFQKEQKSKGIIYKDLADAIKAVKEIWPNEPDSVKAKYKKMAIEKNKQNVKYTSSGISVHVLEQKERELLEAEEAQRHDIRNFIMSKKSTGKLLTEPFYVMDVNWCYRDEIIMEFTLICFNFKDGIRTEYNKILKAYYTSYHRDLHLACKEFGIHLPVTIDYIPTNYANLFENIQTFLGPMNCLPIIYTLPSKMCAVKSFIRQLCQSAHANCNDFKIYKLDTLLYTLVDIIKGSNDNGFAGESYALVELENEPFYIYGGLACKLHVEIDNILKCTSLRAKSWAYTILELCLPFMEIVPKQGQHMPNDYDINALCYRGVNIGLKQSV